MKRKISSISILLLLFLEMTVQAQGFASGTGTAVDPYIINTVAHLQAMHTADYTSPIYVKLSADLDMAGISWTPLNSASPYAKKVHFDGNGHVIKNLKVENESYASLFGVLCGSCKNLGVINANITSTNGGGIIGGYAGAKSPADASLTGMIENCYTTGIVMGTDGVGGIVGNIGKPSGMAYSGIKNCYSTATVIALNLAGNSRVGGLAGIVYDKGVVENSYATGTVKSSRNGAGGIAGWTDTTIKGVVAMNDSIINDSTGNIGRIAAFMGAVNGVQAQGENTWAADYTVVKNANYTLIEEDFRKDIVTERNAPYDGITKTVTFLSDPMNYFQELGWDFASDNNIWAQTMSNGKPIFQWLFNRNDYSLIDGHSPSTGVDETILMTLNIFVKEGQLHIQSEDMFDALSIYNPSGQLIYSNMSINSSSATVNLRNKGVYIISISRNNSLFTKRVII